MNEGKEMGGTTSFRPQVAGSDAPKRATTYCTRRRWFKATFVAVLYSLLWALTHFVGALSVRDAVIKSMRPPGTLADYTDVTSKAGELKSSGKMYYCRAVAYCPMIVRVDFGWGAGSLRGGGGSSLYLWIFGKTILVSEIDHWAE